MSDLKISELLKMQIELCEKYKDKWDPVEPQNARNAILWMIEELGEVVAIIKKRGDSEIMTDLELRKAFTEELADVLMYYTKILLCYNISENELSDMFIAKHTKNMERDFNLEHTNFLKPVE